MHFRSTQAHEPLVSFKDAVLHCLPVEGGLYVPATIPDLRQYFLYMNAETSFPELVSTLAPALLQGELNPFSASRVAESAFQFEPELQRIDDGISLLNLYNGPTGVFKDFGISFLAAVMEELLKNSGRAMILSASRGDTGVSIARAFAGREGITSVILYPSGRIRGLDPESFVPNGGNIIPIQIKGTFDDCQRLINETINDREFTERYGVTSANAINPGRLLPQSFYYLYAFTKIKETVQGELVFSVPSGNFGNLIAGLYAWKFGMPV
ncbi:MAG: threonine synthase, partial [Treponema sp.]|nr:threonine synthase [Treponema sp.]